MKLSFELKKIMFNKIREKNFLNKVREVHGWGSGKSVEFESEIVLDCAGMYFSYLFQVLKVWNVQFIEETLPNFWQELIT